MISKFGESICCIIWALFPFFVLLKGLSVGNEKNNGEKKGFKCEFIKGIREVEEFVRRKQFNE